MEKLPDDMLFYYKTTDGEYHYFSVRFIIKTRKINIEKIEMDELWSLVKIGNLQLTIFIPPDFPYPLPGNISGNVNAFVI